MNDEQRRRAAVRQAVGFLFLPLLATAGLGACRGDTSEPADKPRAMTLISYAAPGLVSGQVQIHQGLERHAKEHGFQVITTSSGSDPDKQAEQILTLIKLRVDAMIAVPESSKGICASVEAARAAKIPFYTIDRAPEGCKVNMAVLSDNRLAGQQSAEALVGMLQRRYGEPKGKVVELAGKMIQDIVKHRSGGFQDVIRRHPGIKLLTKMTEWSIPTAEALLREELAASPDLDGIYLHADAHFLPMVLSVLRETGRLKRRGEPGHIFITGVDGSHVALQAIRDGYMDQASSQPLTDFGIVVEWIEQELKGKPIIEGEVKREGAPWSPARVVMSDIGPTLILSTTSVTEANVNDGRLWANQI